MKDVQSAKDKRGIDIDEVGISNLIIPLLIGIGKNQQQIVCDVKMGVNLMANLKGTHMSRLAEIAEKIKGRCLNKKLISLALKSIKKDLQIDYAKVEFSFTYFIDKTTPISKKICSMNYQCKLGGEINNKGQIINFYEVEVPIATLCPCSKEISKNNAHNQRAKVILIIKTRTFILLEELVKMIEQKASSELFSTLKRVDEKFVTEKMFNKPMFVEDIIRDIALWVKKDNRINDFIVKCKSYESIHNHNAYAIIIHNNNANN